MEVTLSNEQKLKRLEQLEAILNHFDPENNDWISPSDIQLIISKAFVSYLTQSILDKKKVEPEKIQYIMESLLDFLEELKNLKDG